MEKVKTLDLLSYYQTSLRNIGLFTSLSFGSLIYSRFYRGKIWLINILLIIISIIFIITTLFLINFLRNDLHTYSSSEQIQLIDKRLMIPNIVEYVNYGLILISLYILYIQFN